MAEIEITLPTVAFGNVKVRATPEELGVDVSSPAAVGTATAIYLNLFTQGFKMGASMDVVASPTEGLKAPVSASQEAPGPKARTINEVLSDEDVDTVAEAQAILDRELGGVTELPEDGPDGVGVDGDGAAPWTEKVDVKPKPWETDDVPAPPVLDAAW